MGAPTAELDGFVSALRSSAWLVHPAEWGLPCHRSTPESGHMTSAELVGSRPPRRAHARLIVALDGTAATTAELVRALRDAARHEGTVLACAVVDPRADDAERELVRARLEEQVRRGVDES